MEIELLIRAANFDEPFNCGILNSVSFGTQAAIDYARWYSIGFHRNQGGTIHLRVAQQDGFTIIEVKDNGNGMEQDKAAHLLSPTVKGKNGIGLSNTNRRLIRLYGQGLSIVSKPDEGTTTNERRPDFRTPLISGSTIFIDYRIFSWDHENPLSITKIPF